jgi:Kip1 ubiquitination-promoting complex protein 1
MERGAEPRRLPSDSDNEDEGEGVDDDEGDEDVYEDTDESDEEGSVERENVDTDPEMDEDDGTDEDVDEDPGGGRPYDGRVPMTVDDGRVPGVDTRKGALLQHIPAYHLEVLIDSFHALRRGDPPFAPVAPARAAASPGLHGVVKLLVRHFADERVVNPDVRDVMLQSVSVLLQYKEYVAVFEANDEARREMVPALLRSFDSRFWIPVSNILLRLCKGVGFGQYDDRATKVLSAIKATKRVDGVDTPGLDSQRTDENIATNDGSEFGTSPDATLARAIATSVDSSSPLFRALIVDTFREDPKLLERFLDRVFNTLNWTITEFGVALKEMLDMRQRAAAARNLQRKCTVMLELSATLERVLEFLTLELPAAFLDSQASMRMKRLVEILLFVLGHTCGAGSDAKLFEQALSMKLPVFVADKISRAPILAPIAGIILNLEIAAMAWVEGRGDDFGVDEVSDTVADELAAGAGENNISQLEYVCAFDWETHFGSFTGREEAVMELRDVVRRVRDTRGDIERRRKAEDETDVPEEFVDPIMQSFMSDPVTLPGSGVVVDRETIRRHLLTGDGTDPFSRTPLDESMLVDATELRERIDEWRTGLHVTPPDTALEDVD